jgi:hypothetical protein
VAKMLVGGLKNEHDIFIYINIHFNDVNS